MGLLGTVWPVRGLGAPGAVGLAALLLVLVSVIPAGVVLWRRTMGTGLPVWPVVAFVVLATGYAVATPPWQMNDEPQHMVHVEVVRRAGSGAPHQLLPGATASPAVRRALADADRTVVESMVATDAPRWLPGGGPALRAGAVPGPRELSHPPLYYVMAATLTKGFGGRPVLARLAILRALGVLLATATVVVCGAVGRLLWPRRPLAEVPMALALAVPTFVSSGGAVNNDGLAVLFGALLVYVLLRGVLGGSALARPLPWAAAVVAVMAAGVATKRTFLPLVALVALAVLFRLRTRPRALLASAAGTLLVLALAFTAFSDPRLALWEQQTAAFNYRCRDAVTGRHVICLPPGAPSILQKIPLVRAQELEGKALQVALSIRSPSPGEQISIHVSSGAGLLLATTAPATPSWTRVGLDLHAPKKLDGLWLELSAPPGGAAVYVDGVVLRRRAGANQIRNGTGSQAIAGAPSFLPESVQRQVNSAIDAVNGVVRPPGVLVASRTILYRRLATTFSMFWATVGWQVPPPLLPAALNWLLALATVVAIGAAGVVVLRARLPGRSGGILLFGALVMTLAVALRNLPPTEPGVVNGRYLFPGLVAFVALLAAGWGHLWPGDERHFRAAARFFVVVMQGLFIGFVFVPFLAR